MNSEPLEEATTMSVLSGSPEFGESAVMESESLDPDQHNGVWSLYVSMRTWYERYAVNESRPLPPLAMMLFPRLFEKSWGYDRLYPEALNDWSLYHAYLKKFDMHNRHLYANSEAYKLCLEKENQLRSVWLVQGTNVPQDEISLSDNILNCALQLLLSEKGGSLLRMNAATCIAKETEVIIERLRPGSSVVDPEDAPEQSTQIRKLALSYMGDCECRSDVALLALNIALLGIRKEAELMVENLKEEHSDYYEFYLSRVIRGFALEVVTEKIDSFTVSADLATRHSAGDYNANIIAEIEADAEQGSWRDLVEYDPVSEEASGIQSSEKQWEEGIVHHMLPRWDN